MKLQQNASSAHTPTADAASSRRMLKRLAIASTLVGASLLTASAHADVVLLGSDYFKTIQPTFFTPLGPLNPLAGLAIGPGSTDTIVQRQADCSLSLSTLGSNCTIPIEMVALSLISTVDPLVRLRESPTLASTGSMTIASDGSGMGGSFGSFFDVFFDISMDGGASFNPQGPLRLTSDLAFWTTVESGLLVDGLMGDQAANRHTDKGSCSPPQCVDFYLGNSLGQFQSVTERHPGVGVHTAQQAQLVPEPASLGLVGLALAALCWTRRRSRR